MSKKKKKNAPAARSAVELKKTETPKREAKSAPPQEEKRGLRSPGEAWRAFQKLPKEEQLNRGTLFMLVLWTLLPVFAFFLYLHSWIVTAGMAPQETVEIAYVYEAAMQYASLFRIFGIVTVVMVLAHVLAWPRSGYHLKRCARLEPWFPLLLFLLVWALLGTILSDNSFKAFSGSPLQYDGFTSYVIYGGMLLLAFFLTGEGKRRVILRFFTGGANFCVLLMLGQCWGWPVIRDALFRTRSSVFFNLNHFAYYLSLSIVILAGLILFDRGKKRSVWYTVSFLFQLYGLMLNDTFGCYLPMPVALICLYIFYWRKGCPRDLWAFVPAAGFILVSAVYFLGFLPAPEGAASFVNNFSNTASDLGNLSSEGGTGGGGSGRLRLWKEALQILPRHPIVGVGPNSMPADYDATLTRPHNTVLQMAVFHGVPGAFAYCAALITLAVHQFRRMSKQDESTLIAMGGIVMYVLSACFGVPMFYTSIYFFLFLALAAGREEGNPLRVD